MEATALLTLISLFTLQPAYSEVTPEWYKRYAACYHEVNPLPMHDRQTLARRSDARYANAEHIVTKDGIFLLTETEALFIPLKKKGEHVDDQNYVELRRQGENSVFLVIKIDRPLNTHDKPRSVVEISSDRGDREYESLNIEGPTFAGLRKQLRPKLINKISSLAADYAQHGKTAKTPIPAEDVRKALAQCEDLFKHSDKEDRYIKNILARTVAKFSDSKQARRKTQEHVNLTHHGQ